MSHTNHFAHRRTQAPNMLGGGRRLPQGPGPLDSTGSKKISFRKPRLKSPIGPLKAIHRDYENTNYSSQASSPVGKYPPARLKSSSTDDLTAKFSTLSTSSTSVDNNRSSFKSSSPLLNSSYTQRRILTSPTGNSNSYSEHHIKDLYSFSTKRDSSPSRLSSLNNKSSALSYTGSSSPQPSRRRTQSFDNNNIGSSAITRPSSRTRRLSESNRSFSTKSSLPPTDTFAGTGFYQKNKDLRGCIGLTNIGNTCFMNSVLQCLCNCDHLYDYIINKEYISEVNESSSRTKGKLIKAFAYVMKNLWAPETSTRTPFSPKKFKECLDLYFEQFRGARQHDSQEFLRYLLEALHDDTNSVKKRPKYVEIEDNLSEEDKAANSWRVYRSRECSFFSNLFVGQLKSVLECNECHNRSVTFDPFWDLSLPIPRNKQTVSLINCLEEFTKEEALEGDERPMCSKCKAKKKCLKSFSIQRFPKILVIHLKRFSGRSKLTNFVDFPVTDLSLTSFASKTCTTNDRYHLIATSNHSGFTYGGHYIAHAKHAISKKWFCYDDTRVNEVSDKSITSSQAYVLFYQKSTTATASL